MSDSKIVITEVEKEIKQLEKLPRKQIEQAIKNSKLILLNSKEEILNFVNLYDQNI